MRVTSALRGQWMTTNRGGGDIAPPRPTGAEANEPAAKKKRKSLPFEQLYLENLPSCEMYEKSYMHRGDVTDVIVTCNDFIITASTDGQVKFWKKVPGSVEFVKHFRAHLQPITSMSASADGAFLATVSDDKSLKIYDILNFDMIAMVKLDYIPAACAWVSRRGAADGVVAVSAQDSASILMYRARSGSGEAILGGTAGHNNPVKLIAYNAVHDVAVSVDTRGMVEYWDPETLDFPEQKVHFQFKADTSLYEFAKKKTTPISLAFSQNGSQFVCVADDRQVRVFSFLTGKLRMQYNEGCLNDSTTHGYSRPPPRARAARNLHRSG